VSEPGLLPQRHNRDKGEVEVVDMVGHALLHVRHVQGACRPLRHFIGHQVGDVVPDLEVAFGLVVGRTGLGALNQNCCPSDALRT
jgi:hypothetical protein